MAFQDPASDTACCVDNYYGGISITGRIGDVDGIPSGIYSQVIEKCPVGGDAAQVNISDRAVFRRMLADQALFSAVAHGIVEQPDHAVGISLQPQH